jgi:hypothetical protein
MDAVTSLRLPSRLHSLAAMALLLERLENQPLGASAAQYQSVVQRILALLSETPTDPALHSLLAVAPATAQLYENLHYGHAGLCRSPLDQALQAELATSQALRRLSERHH